MKIRLVSRLFSFLVVIVLLASLFAVSTTPVRAADPIIETFKNSTMSAGWVLLGNACLTAGGASNCPTTPNSEGDGNGWLRLTSAITNQAGSAIYNNAFSSTAGVDITFEYATYGGTAADGFTFYLIDGSTGSPTVGAYGGSLGYSFNNDAGSSGFGTPGVTNGFVGIGFDEYGNFSNSEYGTGGPVTGTQDPNKVVIRGPGNLNDAGGFPFLISGNPPASTIGTTDRAGAKLVHITITPAQLISVSINGTAVITNFDMSAHTMPSTFKMGFSASTGSKTNFHEIRNLRVTGFKESTINVVSSLNPSVFGDLVTFTATVTATGGTPPTPTGIVNFYDGATLLGPGTLNGSAIATITTSTLTVGIHTITAVYMGDDVYVSSQDFLDQVVTSSNTPPVAVDDTYSVIMSETLNAGTVLVNDTDVQTIPLTIAAKVTDPAHASTFTFNGNGTFTYIPENGYRGVDTFTYKANDGTDDSNIATVTINIFPTTKSIRSTNIYDGWVLESTQTSGAGGTINPSELRVGDESTNQQYRSIISFNTVSIPDNAVIIGAFLRIRTVGFVGPVDPFLTHSRLIADMKVGSFAQSPLQSVDFQSPALQGNIGQFIPMGATGWYKLVFAKNYYSLIDLITHESQFRLRFVTTDNNDGVANYMRFYSGVNTRTNNPLLSITYYIPHVP